MKTYINPPKSDWEQICTRPVLKRKNIEQLCKDIFNDVALKGDEAILEYGKLFDDVELSKLELPKSDLETGAKAISGELKKALDVAYVNIWKFHKTQAVTLEKMAVETMPGVLCWQEPRPIERVGLYVPGGTAPLISTVLMLGVPAQIAGCKEIILTTPPQKDGALNPAICYAALKVGVSKVIMAGGIQAVAALTFGTESVPKVDKIFGPGNQYVTAAKQYAEKYGVAMDMPAGPSEVMVVADETANPSYVAADLLSQAEHGVDSQVVLIALSGKVVDRVNGEIKRQLQLLPRKNIVQKTLKNSLCLTFSGRKVAMQFANMYAPEHIILSVARPNELTKQTINAGSVFLGNYSPESAGDYASGTNHALPTNKWAKSYGGVSVDSFVKKVTFQKLTVSGLQRLAPTIVAMAQAEGLEAHAKAVMIRTQAK